MESITAFFRIILEALLIRFSPRFSYVSLGFSYFGYFVFLFKSPQCNYIHPMQEINKTIYKFKLLFMRLCVYIKGMVVKGWILGGDKPIFSYFL